MSGFQICSACNWFIIAMLMVSLGSFTKLKMKKDFLLGISMFRRAFDMLCGKILMVAA